MLLSALALGLASPAVGAGDERSAALGEPEDGAQADRHGAPEVASCTLDIRGIPPAIASSYNLRYADRDEPLRSLRHEISFAGSTITVNLTGPRYYGYKTIAREACLAGDVELPVQRKAAALRFEGAPPNTTVECVSGPPCPDADPRLLGEGAGLPDLPMELDLATVELRFKSSGYRPRLQRISIQPGANRIDVDLEPNCGCCGGAPPP